MGSLERFFGVLIEHYAGAFPLWLSPVQVSVLTIAERHDVYAENIVSGLFKQGIRVELDTDSEKIGNKIRKSSIRKIPYSVIIGDNEVEDNKITVRRRNGENIGPFTFDELTSFLLEEINSRR
jgi:threonyl-tRNA synthetase